MSGGIVYPARFRVEERKVRRYLLDPGHADGGPKCAFLLSVGFRLDDPVGPMAAPVRHPTPSALKRVYAVQPQGTRYHFERPMRCPNGTSANVRTVWQIDARSELPAARFITLKPLPKLKHDP